MKFNYSAFDAKNKIYHGVIEATDLSEANKLLIGQGWYIKKIVPKSYFWLKIKTSGFGGISLMDKLLIVRHLATMLKSGISLNESLMVIAEQSTSSHLKKIIFDVLQQVRSGQTLANALAKKPKIFDSLMVNIVRVGEQSGTLEENLNYLTTEIEGRLELQRKIKAAAFYPIIVLISTFGLGFVLAYFVLPKIVGLFKTLNFTLPLSTRILLWVAEVMNHYGFYIFWGIILVLILGRFLLTRRFIRPFSHRLLLSLPVIGRIVANYNLAVLNRTMGILLKSGLTIDQAMSATAVVIKNVFYQRRLQAGLVQIQTGKKLSDVLAGFKGFNQKPVFPLLVVKMINVGERSGRLEESLSYLAEYFEKEVDNTTKNLATILEPILLIFVGLIVGFVAIAVITPIYQVTGQFRQ